MNKKTIYLVLAFLLLVMSSVSFARKIPKGNFYLGVETGINEVKYTFGEDTSNASNIPYEIIYGVRFYQDIFGVGLKSFVSSNSYSYSVNNTKLSAEGLRFGGEVQAYLNFINVGIQSKRKIAGLALGLGYEVINYSSLISENSIATIAYKNYSDKGLFYTASLYFSRGSNQIELGYKKSNYTGTSSKTNADASLKPQRIGFNLTDTIFVAYSFSF